MLLAPMAAPCSCVSDSSASLSHTVRSDLKAHPCATQIDWAGEIGVGQTRYCLKGNLRGFLSIGAFGYVLFMQGFSPTYVGKGKTRSDAEDDILDQIHVSFQTLYSMRPFQMTPVDCEKWGLLSDLIDIGIYASETPLTVREIGRIVSKRSHRGGLQVKWMHGLSDFVPFSKAPAEFAAYKPACWFEAVVKRTPGAGDLSEILSTSRIAPIPRMSGAQAKKYLGALATPDSLRCRRAGKTTTDE